MSRKPWSAYGRYGSVGLELVLSIGLGYYLGHWADQHFHINGWLSLVGFLIGCYTGFRALWTVAKRMQRDVENDERMERGEDPWEDQIPDYVEPKDDEQKSDDSSDDEKKKKSEHERHDEDE